jgi:hypothetical protein
VAVRGVEVGASQPPSQKKTTPTGNRDGHHLFIIIFYCFLLAMDILVVKKIKIKIK